jgi:serine/alanine adding enzyme
MNMLSSIDIRKIPLPQWKRFLLGHPDGNFFQSPECFSFFSSVSNYSPVLFYTIENEVMTGCLLAVIIREESLLKKYFSRRCIVWGGPLVRDNNIANAAMLISSLDAFLKNKVIYTEFRNLADVSAIHEAFISSGLTFHDHLNFIVEVNSIDDARKQLSKSKKRQIDKSLQNGAEIIIAENLEEVEQFYSILSQLYKDKVRKPLPPSNFFKTFFQKELGKFFLIRFDNKIIGGIMCPIYKDTIYEYFIAGLDSEYKDLYPGVLATWAPIEFVARNNLRFFDFMGAGKPDEDYGVREFKSKFGGKQVNYGRYQKIHSKLLFSAGVYGLKLLKKASA